MKNAVVVTDPDNASEITEAKIGPTHGVQISPKLNPKTKPPINPSLLLLDFAPCLSTHS